jgi:hypothetical protein
MIEFNGAPAKPGRTAINFANVESGQEMLVEVHDKFPLMGDVHIEGRRYVEVSVEMFVGLMQQVGWLPVAPSAPESNDGDEVEA